MGDHSWGLLFPLSPEKGEVMKEIHICSLKEYRWLLRSHHIPTNSSYALISSSYPLEPEADLISYSFECYDDIDFDCLGRCLSPEAARRFAKAIKSNPHIDSWYFVCDGGCRRSAAIACAALRFWGYEEEEFKIWSNPRKEPNVWVFTLMSDALGLPIDDIDLDLRIHLNRSAIHSAFHHASEMN